MKRTIISILSLLAFTFLSDAQTATPRWLRQNSISPDGTRIAFVYHGDIFTVPAQGGEATQITTNAAHDTDPVWSPDGRYIVFASFREESKDIYVVPAEGGQPLRITDFGQRETPLTVAPDGTLYFLANIQEDTQASVFPGGNKLYSLNLADAIARAQAIRSERSRQVSQLPAPRKVFPFQIGNMSVNAAGDIIYEDYKGYEDPFRKHHTSAVTRDIWMFKGGNFTKVSDYVGEDTNPVWGPDGTYYYLSEKGGARSKGINGPATDNPQVDDWGGDNNVFSGTGEQLTHFTENPVRFLSAANDGTLCFSWNGDLYTLKAGSEAKKVEISLRADFQKSEHIIRATRFSSPRGLAISPNGKELAGIFRGDVYTTTLELSDTRRITETQGQERGICYGKDGKSLFYASERDGEWGIYKTELKDKKDKYFTFGGTIEEVRITPVGETCFQPAVSPDGKKVAYLRNRTEIVVSDINGRNAKTLLSGANYSYSDGDLPFAWSPDSRWLLTAYQGGGRMYNEDIAIINVESGEITDLTQSGYTDSGFRWALGGKAMTWESDKAGYRSHGSWGAEGDIYIMFFDDEAFRKFNQNEDVEEIDKLLMDDKDKKKEAKKEEKDSTKASEGKVDPLKLELTRREDRIVRLTRNSGRIGDHWLTPNGDKLYYTVQLEKSQDLCCLDLKKGGIKVVSKSVRGSFYPSPDGTCFYILGVLGIQKFSVASNSASSVSFSGEYEYFPEAEREYIFDHCWKQVKEKFYVADLHGVNWESIRDNYRRFLPYINDNYAFQELLCEMLGELNGSHTGARYRDMSGVSTGHMGVIFDEDFAGPGLRIKEFLPGSLLLVAEPSLKPGDVITAINGKTIPAGRQWYEAFQRISRKRVLLTVGGKKVYVIPEGNDDDALYTRWVRRNEQRVKELSGGRIGYVHVEGMDSQSFREVYSKALGKYRNCDALIVDTRHNGGGWLHNDLATFLNGKVYTERRPRGVEASAEPYDKWVKPSCVLVCEDNYSDACGFPYVYKSLGIGKIIGAPVAGTATSVWWEYQIDPTLIFGIPQIGSWSIMENRFLENDQLEPDILVYNDPASVIAGEDKQLEAAVAEMLKETAKHKVIQ